MLFGSLQAGVPMPREGTEVARAKLGSELCILPGIGHQRARTRGFRGECAEGWGWCHGFLLAFLRGLWEWRVNLGLPWAALLVQPLYSLNIGFPPVWRTEPDQ